MICDNNFSEEIKDVAFETIVLNPGCTYERWLDIMMEECMAEITDETGGGDIGDLLSRLWLSHYVDSKMNKDMTIEEWAHHFSTKQDVELYCMIDNG